MTAAHSPVRIRLRYFLRGRLKIDGETSRILVLLYRWAATVFAEGIDAAIAEIPEARTSETVPDVIRAIADHLTENVEGLQGDVLGKSLQETLYFAIGTRSGQPGFSFHASLTAFLRRRGSAGLPRLFLRVHLFNVVWLKTSESFRAVAGTDDDFVEVMESLERICRRIVDSAWKSQMIRGPLDQASASELLSRIEQLILS